MFSGQVVYSKEDKWSQITNSFFLRSTEIFGVEE